jgi:hypothetical protein
MVAIKADLICQGNNRFNVFGKWQLIKIVADWPNSESNCPEAPDKIVDDGDENQFQAKLTGA